MDSNSAPYNVKQTHLLEWSASVFDLFNRFALRLLLSFDPLRLLFLSVIGDLSYFVTLDCLSSTGVALRAIPRLALSLALMMSSAFGVSLSATSVQNCSLQTLYISSHVVNALCRMPLSGLSTVFDIACTSLSFITSC